MNNFNQLLPHSLLTTPSANYLVSKGSVTKVEVEEKNELLDGARSLTRDENSGPEVEFLRP